MKPSLAINEGKTFWILLFVLSLWKVLLAWKLDVCFDEGYYFYWSLYPQLSYFDHPPLTAWAIAVSHRMFGDTIWSVRFWPLLVGVLFPLIGRALAREMFDAETGNRSGIFLTLCPSFAGNGLLMTPDTLFAFFWAASLYAVWNAIRGPSHGIFWWALTGLSVGLGLLSKYNMVLYFLGLGIFWLLAPEKRNKLFQGTVIIGSIAFIVFIPVLVWNLENNWISFRFQLQHGFAAHGFTPWTTFPGYLGGLLIVATPLLGVLVFWSAARGVISGDDRRRILSAFFWGVIVFFAFSALKGQVSPNWPMLGFFSGIILAAADWHLVWKRLRGAAVGLLLLVTFLGLGYLSLPAGFGIAVGERSLDVARMKEFVGGKQVANAVREKWKALNLDFVCASRHQLLGEIAFYAPELRSHLWIRKDGPLRFPWIDHEKWRGKSALLVSRRPRAWKMFQQVAPLGPIEIPYKGKLKRILYVYQGIGYMP